MVRPLNKNQMDKEKKLHLTGDLQKHFLNASMIEWPEKWEMIIHIKEWGNDMSARVFLPRRNNREGRSRVFAEILASRLSRSIEICSALPPVWAILKGVLDAVARSRSRRGGNNLQLQKFAGDGTAQERSAIRISYISV